MNFSLTSLLQWFTLLQQIVDKGEEAWGPVKAILAAHGIEADTSALDDVIVDAARRKALAEREAAGGGEPEMPDRRPDTL